MIKGGDEYDAFTAWRKVILWKRGELARIKRGYARRVRREAREQLRRDPS